MKRAPPGSDKKPAEKEDKSSKRKHKHSHKNKHKHSHKNASSSGSGASADDGGGDDAAPSATKRGRFSSETAFFFHEIGSSMVRAAAQMENAHSTKN